MIDLSNMFDNKPSAQRKDYSNMFAGKEEKKKVEVPVKQTFSFPVSEEEQEIMTFKPHAIYKEVKEWLHHWDKKIEAVSDGNQKLSTDMLNLSQDIARHDNNQDAVYKFIVRSVEGMREDLEPIVQGWGPFKKVIEKELNPNVVQGSIDQIKRWATDIKITIDPFLKTNLQKLIDNCDTLMRDAEQGMIAVLFIHNKNPDDDKNNRKIERLEKIKKLVEISRLNLVQIDRSIQERQDSLTDLKNVAIPLLMNTLSSFLTNKDRNRLSETLNAFVQKKV